MQTKRQQRESELHDQWAVKLDASELLVTETFESYTAFENQFILSQLGSLAGRRILDVGAGAGEASLYFAQKGAEVTAHDISKGQLEVLQEASKRLGLNIETVCGAAEELPFEDASFDIVYIGSVLHHVDFKRAVPEIKRVLKKGGTAVFIEPLTYNPVIEVYRRLADSMRTPDEVPLKKKDAVWIREQFEYSTWRHFGLSTLIVFLYIFFIERVSPNHDRYWKRVLRNAEKYRKFLKPFVKLDDGLRSVPGIKWLAWNIVIVGRK